MKPSNDNDPPTLNTEKPWSETDLFDLQNGLERGNSIEQVANFLCRSTREVEDKMRELGLSVAT